MGRPMDKKNIERLKEGLKVLESLPYKASLRYLFYDLLQKGLYSEKGDYDRWEDLCKRARKQYLYGWAPDSLIDDSRSVYYKGGDYLTVELSHFREQEYYVEVWFEAEAMGRQFAYHTHGLTMRPFKGDYSIPKKWQSAKDIETASEKYRLPVVILYFGDCDTKGQQIPFSAIKDVKEWCEVDFTLEVCGLTLEQARGYNLPVNPDDPDHYQWEALRDEQAEEIITHGVNKYIDSEIIENTQIRNNEIREEILETYFA